MYEYTRTIGFRLEKTFANLGIEADFSINSTTTGDIHNLYILLTNLLEEFEREIFIKKLDGTIYIHPKIRVNYKFLQRHTREIYSQLPKNDEKNFEIGKIEGMSEALIYWKERNSKILGEISRIIELIAVSSEKGKKNKDDLPRKGLLARSSLAFYTRTLMGNDYLGFISDFVDSYKKGPSARHLQEIIGTYKRELLSLYLNLTPDTEKGVEVARASLNYFTVNKKNERLSEQLAECKAKLYEEPFSQYISVDRNFGNFMKGVGIINSPKDIESISIDSLFELLKNRKSEIKKDFYQGVSKKHSYKDLISKFPLFNIDEANFISFVSLKSNDLRRKRYFRYSFKEYIKVNNHFQKIAKERGQMKAQIHSLEKEQNEGRLLTYWAVITADTKGNRELVLVEKKRMADFRRALLDAKKSTNKEYELFMFDSITVRALEKLYKNTFPKNIPNYNKDPIKYLKEILSGRLSKYIPIDLSYISKVEIGKILDKDYANNDKEAFRQDFEKYSYHVSKIAIDKNALLNLQKKFEILIIPMTSYDLERNITKPKEHTNLWMSFWDKKNFDNHFPVRINPEIGLFFRRRINRLMKDTKKMQNRFSAHHYRASFSITNNVGKEKLDLSFKNDEEIIDEIEKFNNTVIGDFIKEHGDNLYYFGVDRGTTELATIGVMQFSKDQYEAVNKAGVRVSFDRPIFTPIEVYKIKDEYLKEKKKIKIDANGTEITVTLYKNPSYFIDEERFFEKREVSFIDLTMAKLIKGKIVINGDIMSYINLKLANGKRQLFENFEKIDPAQSILFDKEGNNFKIRQKITERDDFKYLPFYHEALLSAMSVEAFIHEFQSYLKILQSTDDPTEGEVDISMQKINNYRDALTSNMVGIISHLFNKYPAIINLENMHSKGNIQKQFDKNNESIARRLEWSLYKKFQKIGLVPPQLRQTTIIWEIEKGEEKKILKQIGIIHFVPTKNTSGKCPYCGEITKLDDRKKYKFGEHHYRCLENSEHCGFDTSNPSPPLKEINNSDSVAAYNIAKSK